ncbi:MAG: hypothetical protein Q4B87_00530 [Candidatus Saccharibacteria bacterium]|nr:hypothetical protein [Candidatus Saccharibacteria bacterium]
MDPTNTSPIQPNGTAAPNAAAPATPAASAAPAAPVSPMGGAAPATPASPAAPAAPVSPVAQPNADVANAALNPPTNPVVTPGANPAAGAAAVGGTMSMNQMFQSQPANAAGVFAETTAISVPEGPKPPDPVEEELKAPMKAAQPVPGSIGSAVSMPADGAGMAQPQNVAFNDPAQGGVNPMTANAPVANKKPSFLDRMATKTKTSKKTLIALTVVVGLIVVLLIVVLIMMATGNL